MSNYVLGPNAAREVKRLIRGSGRVSSRPGVSSALAIEAEYAQPFAVQWAASAADGEGAWLVWLPGDQHVVIGDTAVNLAEDLEAAGGDYPTGWFNLDDLLDADEGGTLYVVVDVANKSAELASEADDDKVSVKICTATVTASDGSRSVKPFVTSPLVFSAGGELASPFKYVKTTTTSGTTTTTTHKLTNCVFYFNGTLKTLADFDCADLIEEGGTAYLCGTQAAPSSSGEAADWSWYVSASAAAAPDGGKARNYKLYDFADGAPTVDYRTTFLSIDGGNAVTSVNDQDGDLDIIGGNEIEVTTDGKTIKIAYKEGKEEDPDPNDPSNDPCAHPSDDSGSGIDPTADLDGITYGGGAGGVSGGGTHPGDSDCNCI